VGILDGKHGQRISVERYSRPIHASGCPQPKGQLERPGNAAGDPEAVLWTDHGELLVALAGVGEVAVLHEDSTASTRLGVGRRPCAIAYDPDQRRAFIANSLSDSISIIHLDPEPRTTGVIRLGPRKQLNHVARGERLFYDAHQSFHGWFSCHSCHTEGHANGRLNDNAADGGFGAPKKVISLLGVVDTAPWSWLGKRNDLMHQIHQSIETTMGEVTSPEKAEALYAFMETLTPAPALRGSLTEKERAKGMAVFEKLRCDECHTPPHFTDPESYDVGLIDEVGHTHFNPPSLLGVSQRTQWLHDGRAKSLRSVFEDHRHLIKGDLSDQDLSTLLRFLESL
jgi:cytochrome c peroxidase